MSVTILIHSEEHVRIASEWGTVFAESLDAPIQPIVVGENTEILRRHAQSILEEKFKRQNQGSTKVLSAAESVDEVLKICVEAGSRVIILLHADQHEDWQKKLFETSTFPVAWLCPAASPPTDESHVVGGFEIGHRETNRVSMRLLGMHPSSWALHTTPPAEMDFGQRLDVVRNSFEDESSHPETLLILYVDSVEKENIIYRSGLRLLDHDFGTSVLLVREGESMVPSLVTRFRRWTDSITPPLTRSERIALQEDIESGSKPSFEFLGLISAASVLAAFGLLQNSAAVIIGAMLIAPLMTPILGAGQAITLGNRPLFRTAFCAIGLGFVGAIAASMLFGGLVLLFDRPDLSPSRATEMWARCNPSPIDFCVGLVGGMAAAYARTRSHLSSALAGAAIAAALVPPISTAGLQLVFGIWQPVSQGRPIIGPLIVSSINVLTIMIGSSFVLWIRGMRVRSTSDNRRKDRWEARVVVALILIIMLALVAVLQAKLPSQIVQ
ncbi:DUF389 domain-containing protein [Stieleria sp. JC731]|uniref:DUF389 domain-containing protein n=1 Tax=Pirellulaceae TaxID=2691357 RepID=UPI001E3D4A05|nr:DUF389 domain-containing protein [Stieleria sp. JC731]MCC9602440.1 DUF389 domain-containing protein [Stieleria sp. JC731]